VDKILKGQEPKGLPVEQASKYQLIINLKTAKALGINIPASLAQSRRRGDRITILFAALHDSPFGPKPT
jgi:ABC-type uncharacterized transport system substrate-binding protein